MMLPGRCEFLSDAWLEEAGKFLERECRNRKEQLGGRAFSVSERFTDAPPHLKLPDNVASWGMRYDGENVTVSREFNESADLVVLLTDHPELPYDDIAARARLVLDTRGRMRDLKFCGESL